MSFDISTVLQHTVHASVMVIIALLQCLTRYEAMMKLLDKWKEQHVFNIVALG